MRLAELFPLLALLTACATARVTDYGIVEIDGRGPTQGHRLIAVPATLVVLQNQSVSASYASSIEMSAARGEAESGQLLFYAAGVDECGLRFVASDLAREGSPPIRPEIGVVGYVPVTRPSLVGFHRRGAYPDPILTDRTFSIHANTNQALWYTVRVPPCAEAGVYKGWAAVIDGGGGEHRLPVRLRVYDVDLPRTSFLKTSINFRRENTREERYYGKNWTPELEGQLGSMGLAYRFSTRIDLPLLQVFSQGEAGALESRWTDFDAQASYWMDQGITCFELKIPIDWKTSPRDIHEKYGRILESINEHMVARAWIDRFYFYFYDEPAAFEMGAMRERLEAIKAHAPAIRNILTYGTTKIGESKLLGLVGIWVPNLHQFDAGFASRRRESGEEVWAYACVANSFRGFPDNFRIDWYGTAHRALGWWLFKYGADGFLYWSVDLWRVNPWKTAQSFPWTNGDGMLFYPAPDGRSPPLPSIRAHLMRDAFEDFDLLCLLRRAYAGVGEMPAEVRTLLSAEAVITGPSSFSRDDEVYVRSHRRILELLEAAGARAPLEPLTRS